METIIKGEMIKWARERAGLSPESLAEKLQISPDTVINWESGNFAIPVSKAKTLSKISLIPYGILFADYPPEEKITIPDFRTHGSVGLRKPSPELLETINDTKLKQEWYKEYLILEDFNPLEFIGKYNTGFDPEFIAVELKKILMIDDAEYLKCQDWEAAFTYLINHAEDAGITVIVNGMLKNNTHRPLDIDEFRGFVLSDVYAPLVFINGQDSKAARMFTLIHEIAHLLIGESGILDITLGNNISIPHERWCNRVAAEFLTPKSQVLAIWNVNSDADINLDNLKRRLKVSRLVCIYRAFELNLISADEKNKFVSKETAKIESLKKKNKEKEGGPSSYLMLRYKNGRNLALAVISEVKGNRMLYRDAFRLLGISSAQNLDKFASRLGY